MNALQFDYRTRSKGRRPPLSMGLWELGPQVAQVLGTLLHSSCNTDQAGALPAVTFIIMTVKE